ncbi:uncharacterized protein [Watersipora subatra]|uniref:uncharacterized protein n=1 Tax=Watersipora subatra TaxID=2589382 RepID=UPI00355ADF69
MGRALLASLVVLCLGIEVIIARPGNPVRPASDCLGEGYKFADDRSVCWYHQCLVDEAGYSYTIPRRCALGSRVDDSFVEGERNPCTINWDTNIGYECERANQPAEIPPPCASDGSLYCYNGGILTYEADRCWCLCDFDWEGDFDCSKPTGFYDVLAAHGSGSNNICVDGEPDDDYCVRYGGCLNGGVCYNQCRGFWCDCPKDEYYSYYGKRCETSKKK